MITQYKNIVAGAVIVVVLGLFALIALHAYRLSSQLSDAKLELSDLNASYHSQRAKFESDARAKELEMQRQMDNVEIAYLKDLEDAKSKSDRVIADLRNGTIKLRNHWQACISTAELSRAAEHSASVDENARLREAAIQDILRTGSECDAQVRGLQRACSIK